MPAPNRSRCSHLASQEIGEGEPGSVLEDFEVLLGFIEDGVPSSGKFHLLPMARLFELDELMTRPLRPLLKRPQQKSFPHLNGLYMLLRATQLGNPEGHGKASGQLTLDSAMHKQWLQLNETERYFNLLEAWLRRGTWEAIGLGGGRRTSPVAGDVCNVWRLIPPTGLTLSKKERKRGGFLHSVERSCMLALLELFGLITVVRDKPEEGQNWCVKELRRTRFGDELLQIVFNQIEREHAAQEKIAADYGVWQPLLQSYFPQWVNNLRVAKPKFRDGVYHFKVSLGKPWRRIALPAECNLDDLAQCVIRAFEFDGDHLYGYQFVARDGHRIRIEHPFVDDADMHTDEIAIGDLPLTERQSMLFQYDFGADWQFEVQLETIAPDNAEISKPTIVESRGAAPPEYDDEDEW